MMNVRRTDLSSRFLAMLLAPLLIHPPTPTLTFDEAEVGYRDRDLVPRHRRAS